MTAWAQRRFWRTASVAQSDAGFAIRLDDRPVRTPAKAPLILPTRALAEAVAQEWDAQDERIVPQSMPMTRMANSAIDKVAPQREQVETYLAAYAETDLVCYRAEGPAELVARQAAEWDPWLDWLQETRGARLKTVHGVMPEEQDPAALALILEEVRALSDFELSAFHDLVSLPGSFVLALAVASGDADPLRIWEQARVDEVWQIEQWGEDEEAERVNALKRHAFLDAARFFRSASILR